MNQCPLQGCYGCRRSEMYRKDLKLCGKCKKVWYCSQACQRGDWTRHKVKCSVSHTQDSISQSELAIEMATRAGGNGTLMLNLELYAVYLLNLIDDPRNATRWVVEIECAAISACNGISNWDPSEFMLNIGEIKRSPSSDLTATLLASGPGGEDSTADHRVNICFLLKAGAECKKVGAVMRSPLLFKITKLAMDMGKENSGDIIPGTTESGIMYDLKMEFNDMVRRDTRNRFKLREFIPPAEGSQARFRPFGHIGFSGVVPLGYSGAMQAFEDRCQREEEAEAARAARMRAKASKRLSRAQ
ncbi:hypothetical protein BOTBODRAFT_70156 [Botryobasidium botryosum FD-172 SS1]|uniref:MYND-type domain-containing protein n=1 Tax=Botryobasidium botryosum (strain FD-172 SS1) TaxID=930990 RepID=A0A067M7K0_BOTB1|nr:hypothetical protein BOTBODRAFT_70156 [Botryobasidium botryosum FD-172 SS1]